MTYKILYPEAFPLVECQMRRGESIQAESDAMVAMSGTMDVEAAMSGGVLSGLARKMLTGESFFTEKIIARRGDGTVYLSHSYPGCIQDVELDGTYSLLVQKGGYLASTGNVSTGTAVQNLAKGLLSKNGFFVLKLSGRGIVFLSTYGAIHAINVEAGEEYIVDNGHVVAWPEYMPYSIDKASSGWLSSLASGEGLICRFRGPGTVLIQTRNPAAFGRWVRSFIPTQSSS